MEWESFATVMEALLATLHGFSTFMQVRLYRSTYIGYRLGLGRLGCAMAGLARLG